MYPSHKNHPLFSFIKTALLFVALSFITACSDSDSSSENSTSQTDTSTIDGVTVSFSQTKIRAGDVVTVSYDLGTTNAKSRSKEGLTGTIRWGDVTETRIRGTGKARHRYKPAGSYNVSVQVDGGKSQRFGTTPIQS